MAQLGRPNSSLRRRLTSICSLVLAAVALVALGGCGRQTRDGSGRTQTVTDVMGRKVTVPLPATRVLLGGGRLLYTTALLDRQNPLRHVVGIADDLEQNDPDSLRQYERRFPALRRLPRTGQVYDGSFSVENAIRLRPDVFVLSAADFQAAQQAGTIDRLARAGIPTVTTDYFLDPIHHTIPSVELLGRVLGRTAQADAYVRVYRAAMDRVRTRLARAREPATRTFLWRAPGYFDCCSSFARSNLAQLVTFAGGANLADSILKTPQGTLSPETVVARRPAVIIATGADWSPDTPAKPGSFVALGYDESGPDARRQLAAIVARQPGLGTVPAVRDGRTYVVWHHFYDSPYNFLAAEWFAKWMHPDLFADVHPTAEIRQLHARFLPIPYRGTFWTSLSR